MWSHEVLNGDKAKLNVMGNLEADDDEGGRR